MKIIQGSGRYSKAVNRAVRPGWVGRTAANFPRLFYYLLIHTSEKIYMERIFELCSFEMCWLFCVLNWFSCPILRLFSPAECADWTLPRAWSENFHSSSCFWSSLAPCECNIQPHEIDQWKGLSLSFSCILMRFNLDSGKGHNFRFENLLRRLSQLPGFRSLWKKYHWKDQLLNFKTVSKLNQFEVFTRSTTARKARGWRSLWPSGCLPRNGGPRRERVLKSLIETSFRRKLLPISTDITDPRDIQVGLYGFFHTWGQRLGSWYAKISL